MKPGDKAWVYLNLVQAIQEVTVREVRDDMVDVAWDFTDDDRGEIRHCSMNLFATEVFPTREALCEHYRKIFE